jgi:hypothetical protein
MSLTEDANNSVTQRTFCRVVSCRVVSCRYCQSTPVPLIDVVKLSGRRRRDAQFNNCHLFTFYVFNYTAKPPWWFFHVYLSITTAILYPPPCCVALTAMALVFLRVSVFISFPTLVTPINHSCNHTPYMNVLRPAVSSHFSTILPHSDTTCLWKTLQMLKKCSWTY